MYEIEEDACDDEGEHGDQGSLAMIATMVMISMLKSM